MTDTDITALIERLREHAKMAALTMYKHHVCWKAADALEELQTERDAALFDKAVAGGRIRVARNAALEEAAQVAENNDYWPREGEEIAAAIRALKETSVAEVRAEKAEAALKEQQPS